MPDVEAILDRLDQGGYHLTGPRRMVLAEIISRTTPFTSAELLDDVQRKAPTVGRATVFRTIDLLCRLGIVQRIHEDAAGGRCHAYLACDEHHHHHLICQSCGKVTDFREDATLDALVRAVEQRTAFRVEAHRLELIGVCPDCQTSAVVSSDPRDPAD
jgi:Fur family ferric uptake transcriptional regulator